MENIVISCYQLVQQQRVDGLLRYRADALHFEADFPSQYRFRLPLHQVLGFQHHPAPNEHLQFLTERGTIVLYAASNTSSEMESLDTLLHDVWTPPYTNDPSHSTTQDRDPLQHPSTKLKAYIEGQCIIQGPALTNSTRTSAAIQVHPQYIDIFRQDYPLLHIGCTEIEQVRCFKRWWSNDMTLEFQTATLQISFHGTHVTQLWAYLDNSQQQQTEHLVWNDKAYWWYPNATLVLSDFGVHSFSGRWLSPSICAPTEFSWDQIHTLDFGNGKLRIHHTEGVTQLGVRHSTSFYKNVVEQMVGILSQEGLVGLWDDNRSVHLGRLSIEDDTLIFQPRNTLLSTITYPLSSLWMPQWHEPSQSFIQIRTPSDDKAPSWLIIHCGHSQHAQHWVSRLNLPSQRIQWSTLSKDLRQELLDEKVGNIRRHDSLDIPVQMFVHNEYLLIQCPEDAPNNQAPLEFWFDDGERLLRLSTTLAYQQDIPVRRWVLEPPSNIDIYNYRAHHRTHVHWLVYVLPLQQHQHNGWLPDTTDVQQATMRDISQSGCALESEDCLRLPEHQRCILQIHIDAETEQLIGIVKYQTFQQESQTWRIGFEFEHQHTTVIHKLRVANQT